MKTKPIYTLYFDAEGCGPTAIEIKLTIMGDPTLKKMREERRARLAEQGAKLPPDEPDPIGMRFEMGGGFRMNNAPIGAGFFFQDRASLEELHRQLGDLLEKTALK